MSTNTTMLLLASTHKYGNDISKICLMKPVDDTEEYCSTILSQNFIIRNTVLQMHQLHIYLQILKEYLNPNFACKTGFNFYILLKLQTELNPK